MQTSFVDPITPAGLLADILRLSDLKGNPPAVDLASDARFGTELERRLKTIHGAAKLLQQAVQKPNSQESRK